MRHVESVPAIRFGIFVQVCLTAGSELPQPALDRVNLRRRMDSLPQVNVLDGLERAEAFPAPGVIDPALESFADTFANVSTAGD